MLLAWASDVHLDHCSNAVVDAFMDEIRENAPDALVLCGDISNGTHLYRHLGMFEALEIPTYFVLGNHDAYNTSIADSRDTALAVSRSSKWVHYLPDQGVVELTEGTCLVGHGCWGDARAGSWTKSNVMLNDYVLIDELAPLRYHKHLLRQRLEELGDEAADWFRKTLPETKGYEEIIVATHVPPWRESAWYNGKHSDRDWAPHFSCVAAGNALRDHMESHESQEMLVLCGHTHGEGRTKILPNLTTWTSRAAYGAPWLAPIIEIG